MTSVRSADSRSVGAEVQARVERLRAAVLGRLGLPPPLVSRVLSGRMLQVRYGICEAPDYDTAWFRALSSTAHRLLDVGANQGESALIFMLAAQDPEAILVEANPDALALAAENLIRNGLSASARFVEVFAGASDGEQLSFWTVGAGAAGSRYASHARSAARGGHSRVVSTLTLDTLCARYAFVPDLVKIDVEGAEIEVLRGARTLVERGPRFMVELHSNPELPMERNASDVLSWAAEVGYSAWYLKTGERLLSAGTVRHRGRCHLLMQPQELPYPESLRGIQQGD